MSSLDHRQWMIYLCNTIIWAKRKVLMKHSLHEEIAAMVLLRLFINSNGRCHTNDDPISQIKLLQDQVGSASASYPVGLAARVGEDAVHPVVVLIQVTEHQVWLVHHEGVDADQLVALLWCLGALAAARAPGQARLGRHGQRVYQDLDAGRLTTAGRPSHYQAWWQKHGN